MKYMLGFFVLMVLFAGNVFAKNRFEGKGVITISCNKEGAYIYVDGNKKGWTDPKLTSLLLDKGDHTIKIVKYEGTPWQYLSQKHISVQEGQNIKISFILKNKIVAEGKTAQDERYKRVKNVVIDKKQNLMWQDDVAAKDVLKDWNGAKLYCENLSLEGYSDWRLPAYDELLSIVDYDRYKPAIIDLFQNVTPKKHYKEYWSSSVDASDSKRAWYVDFRLGSLDHYATEAMQNTRCVRDK